MLLLPLPPLPYTEEVSQPLPVLRVLRPGELPVPPRVPHGTWLLGLSGNQLTEVLSGSSAGPRSLKMLLMTNSLLSAAAARCRLHADDYQDTPVIGTPQKRYQLVRKYNRQRLHPTVSSLECLNPEGSLSDGSFEDKVRLWRRGRRPHPAQTPRSDQHGAEDAHVVSNQLHLVPELHLASVVPVAQVAVDEQDHQGQGGGQDLSGQADVVAREEGQSQHPKQHLQQDQSDLSAHDVVQIGLLVLFAVLEGVHLVGETDEVNSQENLSCGLQGPAARLLSVHLPRPAGQNQKASNDGQRSGIHSYLQGNNVQAVTT
ncbi:hypothetical protein EYF80_004908 [Liparis tanakae]|uniref:Uncharacterized protein n=1 Tax=Liparis tanakae TaxID=230148 RepID=A0A4Z2J5Q8_9TELE|nr:hypothetical protein EYF80_004908 [Liparis tanakae]